MGRRRKHPPGYNELRCAISKVLSARGHFPHRGNQQPDGVEFSAALLAEGLRVNGTGKSGLISIAEEMGIAVSPVRSLGRAGKPKPAYRPPEPAVASANFLETYEWRRLRMQALTRYGSRCQCCGAVPGPGVVMNVDHIKPRKLFPNLALDINNLQILCSPCNHGKGNWDTTDWRPKATVCGE